MTTGTCGPLHAVPGRSTGTATVEVVAIGARSIPNSLPDPVVVRPRSEFDDADDGPDRRWCREQARALLGRALAPPIRDDRFEGDWPPPDLLGAFEVADGRATGFLGGTVTRGRLQLDGLLVEPERPVDEVDGVDDGAAVDRAENLWRALEPLLAGAEAAFVELWGHPARPWHAALAARHDLVEARALHQLRCSLPVEVEVLPTRPFVPGRDEDALIEVNNRAFASHPDQGGMTRATLEEAARQPWFVPDGVRLHDDPDRPGHLAGFCWTKIHQPLAPGEPRLGEIYAIGVDPSHHGRGLGVPMTGAGLRWLADQGLTTGMLYVEADNEPALRTYDRLGFTNHRTDRAWRRSLVR